MNPPADLLFRDVEVEGVRVDVLVSGGIIASVAPRIDRLRGVEVVDGEGGALLPGLHDHHLHLAALAAAMGSLHVGPPDVTSVRQFERALSDAAAQTRSAGGWIRAVGYHESVAGALDRHRLDAIVADRPLRVQDRSGMRWTLNTAGLERLGAQEAAHPGIERDGDGAPTGILQRADDWLSERLDGGFPDLTAVGRRLAKLGITGVTDCTPYRERSGFDAIAAAVTTGRVQLDVVVTGAVELVDADPQPGVRLGPVKLVLDEADLPTFDDTVDVIATAHHHGRNVAIHLVTAASLAFALAAWNESGARPGDRIEHGSVITPDAAAEIARLGLIVVTQPGFVAERGDRYLADVDPDEIPHLYRCGTLLAAGVTVAGSSDAPYSDADPWKAMRAARERRSGSGVVLGEDERVDAATALDLFLRDPLDLRRTRRVAPGSPADLCLLHRPLTDSAKRVSAADVRSTFTTPKP